MDKQELIALASAVEKLEGPCREMDAWIWFHSDTLLETCPETKGLTPALAVGYYSGRRASIPEDVLTMADVTPAYGCPRFTSSIDAAMTLVPEGYVMASLKQRTRYEIAEAMATSVDPNEKTEWTTLVHLQTNERTFRIGQRHFHHGNAATPALALCAASLRARASITRTTGDGDGNG